MRAARPTALSLLSACAALLFLMLSPSAGQTPDAEEGISFGDVTKKFIRNMNLLKTMSHDAELARQIGLVVAKAEDLHSISILKNADSRRSQIMRMREKMLNREGIKESDQKRMDELQKELRELDPEGRFAKARSEMNRALGEFQNSLGQVLAPDPRSEDVMRLLRLHVQYYNQCLSKLP